MGVSESDGDGVAERNGAAERNDADLGAIESVGVYVPRSTISADTIGAAWDGFEARGISEKRVPAADEDSVTMAVAAVQRALADSDHDRDEIASLAFGTTTPPLDEGEVGATIVEILGLDAGTEVAVHTQSTRAGTRAVVDGLRAAGPAVAVAADEPRGPPADGTDHAAGAGAVAVVLTGEGAVSVTDHATDTEEFAGTRFRERGAETVDTYGATAYEREAYTTVVGGAVSRLQSTPEAIAPTAPDGSLPPRAVRGVDGDPAVYHLADRLGDTGAASALFGLLAAWDAGESSVAVVGYGDGASADALAMDGALPVSTEWPGVDRSYQEYLRQRGHLGGGD